MTTKERILQMARERIIILDGGMGTMVQSYHLTEEDFRGERFKDVEGQLKGNNDIIALTRPDVLLDIHRRYLKAGADIITTNTFSSQRVSQADYHLEDCCYEMARRNVELARQAADEYATPDWPRFVAGSIGPTNKTLSMSGDVNEPAARELTYDELLEAYKEQAEGLIDGGIDLFALETIFDTLNAKCAIDACEQVMAQKGVQLPIMVSMTVSDLAGRTLSGQTIDAFLSTIIGYPNVISVGLNCSLGAAQMKPFMKQFAQKAPCLVQAYPNAGLPNSMGLYDETAETMAAQVKEYLDEGLVNIIGGCCGTDDTFIHCFYELAQGKTPRVPQARSNTMWLAGLEQLDVTPEVHFVNVGERCNVAGSRKFLRLIKEKKYDEALLITRRQVEDGALVIDVNMDDGLLDAPVEMAHFLNLMASEPDIARVPVMIDSSDWNVVMAALKVVQGKPIINSISLKEGEEVFVRHARDVKRFNAAVVVMCFDEIGQAATYERKIEIAQRSYKILVEQVGFNPHDIIIDPNVLAVATGMEEHDAYALNFIKATGWIRKNLPGAHVSGGVSNLSFSFRGNNYIREAMHAVFLYHTIAQGQDFGIVNPATKITYADIPADQLEIIEDVILDRKAGASEALIALADKVREEAEARKAAAQSGGAATVSQPKEAWRDGTLDSRLVYAMRKGVTDYLEQDIHEALEHYPHAVDVIEGPLMKGMDEVGELFGQGKMFLPQVVKTARVMKAAVAMLQPYIEAEKVEGSAGAGKFLIATVKGDVHDIGKNIVAVVMACNNYSVVDLGTMVPAEQIVRKAIEEKADIVGLSGLITPSLTEMVNVAREMKAAGLRIPIIVGGATTSELHTALKIAPEYDGPVVWCKDAAQDVIIAAKLLNPKEREGYLTDLYRHYAELRAGYEKKQTQLASLDEAREGKLQLF